MKTRKKISGISVVLATAVALWGCTSGKGTRTVQMQVPKMSTASSLNTASSGFGEESVHLQFSGGGLGAPAHCVFDVTNRKSSGDCTVSDNGKSYVVDAALQIPEDAKGLMVQVAYFQLGLSLPFDDDDDEGDGSGEDETDAMGNVVPSNTPVPGNTDSGVAEGDADYDGFRMRFFYDAATVDLGSAAKVTLKPSLKMSEADGIATFSGKFINSKGQAPNGTNQMLIHFDKSHPPMIMSNEPVYAGFARGILVHATVPIDYRINGESYFGGPQTLETMKSYLKDNAQQIIEIGNPNGNETGYMGFAGPGANSSHKMCVGPNIRTSDEFESDYSANKCDALDSLLASGNGPQSETEMAFLGELYKTRLFIGLDSSGHQETDFHGVFKLVLGSQTGMIQTSDNDDGSPKSLIWSFLPGAESLIGGTRVYVLNESKEKILTDIFPLLEGDKDFNCMKLLSGQTAYKQIGDVKLQSSDNQEYKLTSADKFEDPHVILCPYDKGGRPLGISVDNLFHEGGDDGGGSDNPYLRVEGIFNYDDTTDIHYAHSSLISVCQPVEFRLYHCTSEDPDVCDTDDFSLPSDTTLPIYFDQNSDFVYYSSSACDAGDTLTSTEIPGGQHKVEVWVQFFGSPSGDTITSSEDIGVILVDQVLEHIDFYQFEDDGDDEYRLPLPLP